MDFTRTKIPDVLLIQPKVFEDERGFFMETFRESEFCELGIRLKFTQDSHSGSQKGVLRGLHYQIQHPQGKLVRAVVGEIFDVAVDIRKSSATFGQWAGVVLSAKNKQQLWIPPGFAHGFFVLSDWAEIVYKSTDNYAPEFERCILWNDPELNIEWPVQPGQNPLVSAKDSRGSGLKDAEVFA
jgi:dTDP-4-dehydrorhamnose 3,5-epimerase